MINSDKSSIVFFGRRSNFIQNVLGCKEKHFLIKYLRLPIKLGKLSKRDWFPLLDSVQRKLERWRGKLLSLGGRIALLSTVLSATPLYYMFFLVLPKWVRKKIDKIKC